MSQYIDGADFSKWDGGGIPYHTLNWEAYHWPFAFIKVSEGYMMDPLFMQQWEVAKGKTIRGPYHYFRPSVDPKLSADRTIDFLNNDPGELPLMFDLETTDGWPDTLERARSWLAWYEQWTGIRPIIYSSPNFLTNIVKASNHPWLSHYKLVLAQYLWDEVDPDSVRDQIIHDVLYRVRSFLFPAPPFPFQRVSFCQWTAKGKPEDVPGYYLGSGHKLAVDLIFYQGNKQDMSFEFDIGDLPPATVPISMIINFRKDDV
jgi:hypothetical protein